MKIINIFVGFDVIFCEKYIKGIFKVLKMI
jgi:hypothetical protein